MHLREMRDGVLELSGVNRTMQMPTEAKSCSLSRPLYEYSCGAHAPLPSAPTCLSESPEVPDRHQQGTPSPPNLCPP